jgi:hypothetical protein
MTKSFLKPLTALVFVSFFTLIFSFQVQANTNTDPLGIDNVDPYVTLSNKTMDPHETVMQIVNYALSFMALLALLIMLWGGFKWMTAGGNDDQVGQAKKIIIAGVIGLAIIMSAWVITKAVVTAIEDEVLGVS